MANTFDPEIHIDPLGRRLPSGSPETHTAQKQVNIQGQLQDQSHLNH